MRHALLTLACFTVLGTAQAESLASSAIGAGSASVGSVSGSVESSTGSSRGGRRAEGRYKVTDVAQAEGATLRLTLQRDDGDALVLTLPQQALAARPVAVGAEVHATPQPYGTAFAHADTGTAFFLVLDDTWHRELAARPVKP